ncbi:50S ribosomal protein L10 [Astathelohania contejeani]|uniref:50S ribosomal protein L10 n=1 Tax=Astathelohania contejeani TaxID=164912 RepID=A0ABQ7I2U3_9MICR|nr:50S ribosomal protein L10 [Thelohania contejeani]
MKIISKKTKEKRDSEFEKIKELYKSYKTVMMVDMKGIQTTHLQELKHIMKKDAKITVTKKRIYLKAIENKKLNDFMTNCTANTFLLFSNNNFTELVKKLSKIKLISYLNKGDICSKAITMDKGVVIKDNAPLPTHNYKKLRSAGIPVRLDGNIILDDKYELISKGDVVDTKMANILKVLGYKLNEISFKVICGLQGEEFIKI